MTKIELQARVLMAEINNPDFTVDQKTGIIEGALRSNAADVLNQLWYFKEKAVAPEVIKELISQAGMDLDLRTNKFK